MDRAVCLQIQQSLTFQRKSFTRHIIDIRVVALFHLQVCKKGFIITAVIIIRLWLLVYAAERNL